MRIDKSKAGYTARSGGVSKTFKRKSEAKDFLDKFRAAKTNTRHGTKHRSDSTKLTRKSPRSRY